MFYIGSTSIDKINSGYIGSVKSKEYKNIFQKEKQEFPHLFKTKIIFVCESRETALHKELKFQQHLNVVKSSMYMNKSLAKDFGWFGMNHSGINSPVYGKRWTKTIEQRQKISNMQSDLWKNSAYKEKMSQMRKGKYHRPQDIAAKVTQRRIEILNLYKSKPVLEHGYRSKNGKMFTYDQAFAINYSNMFDITPQAIRAIIK
jgi:hypothetical protein